MSLMGSHYGLAMVLFDHKEQVDTEQGGQPVPNPPWGTGKSVYHHELYSQSWKLPRANRCLYTPE